MSIHKPPRRLRCSATVGALLLSIFSAGATLAASAIATGPTRLVDGPLPGALLVAAVPAGARVGVLWCGQRVDLCLVSFHGKSGFTSLENLHLVGSSGVADIGNKAGPGVSPPPDPKAISPTPDEPRSYPGPGTYPSSTTITITRPIHLSP